MNETPDRKPPVDRASAGASGAATVDKGDLGLDQPDEIRPSATSEGGRQHGGPANDHEGDPTAARGSAHEKHGGHGGHADHAAMFRERFWWSLLLTVPIVVFSPMVQDWVGVHTP